MKLGRFRATTSAHARREHGRREPDAPVLQRARLRLVLWSGATTLLLLCVLGASLYFITATELRTSGENQLRNRAERFAQVAKIVPKTLYQLLPIGLNFGSPSSSTIAVVVGDERTIYGPPDRPDGMPDEGSIEAAKASGSDMRIVSIDGVPFRVLSQTIATRDGSVTLQVLQDMSNETRTLDTLRAILLFGGFAILAGALAAGWFYSGRAMVPIRESLRRQRQFAADASHELRTPLAVIRATVDDLRASRAAGDSEVRTGLDDIVEETDRISALVSDLLVLARIDSSAIEIEMVDLDLAAVARDAVESLRSIAEDREVDLAFSGTECHLQGDPSRLRQLVTILVDNAIRHTPARGTVAVSVAAGSARKNGLARLMVEDDGPGIPPEQLDRVFDRFWRGTHSPGTGLGLAIAAWIVKCHNGHIRAANRDPGGARFEVELPGSGD